MKKLDTGSDEQNAFAMNVSSGAMRPNPLGGLNIVVSVPHTIEVRMVDASALADYEVWFFISSILSGAVIGFLVAVVQAMETNATNTRQLVCTAGVFTALFLISTATTFVKRYQLRKRGRMIELRATEVTSK